MLHLANSVLDAKRKERINQICSAFVGCLVLLLFISDFDSREIDTVPDCLPCNRWEEKK